MTSVGVVGWLSFRPVLNLWFGSVMILRANYSSRKKETAYAKAKGKGEREEREAIDDGRI